MSLRRVAWVLSVAGVMSAGVVAGQTPDPEVPEARRVDRSELVPVPEPGPETERLSETDREQLVAQHRQVAAMLEVGEGVSNTELGNAFGRLGQLYYAFEVLNSARIAFLDATILAPEQFGWHYYLAAIHMAEGELDQTLEELDRVLELRPEDLPSIIRRGRVLLDLGRVEEAEGAFQKAHELDPDSAAAHHGLGEVCYEQDRLEEAVAHFERALELQPEATSVQYKLGLTYRKIGDLEKAREHLSANRSDPVSFPDPLIVVLDRFVHHSRPLLKAGNLAMEDGKLEEAAELYRRAVEADPEDALAQYNLGFVLIRFGQRDEAEKRFRKAIELDPDYRNAHYNLASVLAQDGRWEKAAEHYERAVEIDPEDYLAHLEWATALAAAGKLDRAVVEAERILEEAPKYEPAVRAETRVLLGRLAASRGSGTAALDQFRLAVEEAPEDAKALQALAGELARLGRYEEAVGILDRAVTSDPEAIRARFGRAMALIFGGREADARRTLESDLRAVGEAPPLVHLLARLLATSSDPQVRDGELAIRLAVHAFRQQGSLDRIETVAMAWAEAGNFDNAADWEQRVINIAERNGRPEVAERARRRLEGFRRGEPARSPWAEESGN